mgnify:CR=1 FL=1
MDITLRGLQTTDIPAWNRLLAEAEKADRTGEHYNEADLAEEMANPDIEPSKDLVGAFLGEEMVGYFSVYARSAAEEVHKIHLGGVVRPDHRGQGIGWVAAIAHWVSDLPGAGFLVPGTPLPAAVFDSIGRNKLVMKGPTYTPFGGSYRVAVERPDANGKTGRRNADIYASPADGSAAAIICSDAPTDVPTRPESPTTCASN